MGCFQSKEAAAGGGGGGGGGASVSRSLTKEAPTQQYQKPVWTSNPPMSAEELQRKRDEFWDTQPHYGGSKGASR
jgi:hypothetical protein